MSRSLGRLGHSAAMLCRRECISEKGQTDLVTDKVSEGIYITLLATRCEHWLKRGDVH